MERERSGYSSVRNSKYFSRHMVEKSVNMVSELRRPTGDTQRGRESSYDGSQRSSKSKVKLRTLRLQKQGAEYLR